MNSELTIASGYQPPVRSAPQEQADVRAGLPSGAEGYFKETRTLHLVRVFFRWLSRQYPQRAADIGYALITRPPRLAVRPWQNELRLCAQRQTLGAGARRIAVYSWGRGPVVLMVNGWGANAAHMGRMILPLTDAGFRVVSFDPPAHGSSGGRTTDPIDFANAIRRVTDACGTPHAVVAHSFGASMVALALHEHAMTLPRRVLIAPFDHCKWFAEAFGVYIGLAPAVVTRMRDMMNERYSGRIDWDRLSTGGMLAASPAETLLIHDEDDAEISIEHSRNILDRLRGAQMLTTRGLGHHRLLGDAEVISRVVSFCRHGGESPAI